MTTDANESEKGETFVTLADKRRSSSYRAERSNLTSYILNKNPGSELINVEMRNKVDLILPDVKTKGEVVCKKILKDPKVRDRVIKAMQDEWKYTDMTDEQKKEFAKKYKSAMEQAVKKSEIEVDPNYAGYGSLKDPDVRNAFSAFTRGMNDPKLRGIYIRELKKKGYNAVADDNMDGGLKETWAGLRENLYGKVTAKGATTGMFVGAAGGWAAGVPTIPTSAAGAVAGAKIWQAVWSLRNPSAPSSVSSSSLIIFDREGTLEIVRKKPYKGIKKKFDSKYSPV